MRERLAGEAGVIREESEGVAGSQLEPQSCCFQTITVICFYPQDDVAWEIQEMCRNNNDDDDNSCFIFPMPFYTLFP